jgi:hypothetical protein
MDFLVSDEEQYEPDAPLSVSSPTEESTKEVTKNQVEDDFTRIPVTEVPRQLSSTPSFADPAMLEESGDGTPSSGNDADSDESDTDSDTSIVDFGFGHESGVVPGTSPTRYANERLHKYH